MRKEVFVELNFLQQEQSSQYAFDLGLNQLASSNFIDAIDTFKKANIYFLKQKRYRDYLKSQIFLIIIYTEMERFGDIQGIRHELSELVWQEKLGVNYSQFHYALGFCFLRQKNYDKASGQFNQALALILKRQKEAEEQNVQKDLVKSKIDMCFILYGFACLYAVKNQVMESIQELKNMESVMKWVESFQLDLEDQKQKIFDEQEQRENSSVLDYLASFKDELGSLEFGYNLLMANLLKKEKKYDSAEKLYWFCYEQSQKSHRRKYMSPHLLYSLGSNYMEKGDYKRAFTFLNLASKSVNPDILKQLHKQISKAFKILDKKMTNNYDIVLSLENKVVVEKQKGHINFKNQFILLDMLKLFAFHPGYIYSKESLVEKVWKQKYDPKAHDNKIYVTIKRLRELIEPDQSQPKYIFRTKNGYYIDKKAKILIE